MISALSNVNKSTTRKRVLTESNADYIEIDKSYVFTEGSKIEFDYTPTGLASESYRGILDTVSVSANPGRFLVDTRLSNNGVINVEINNDNGDNVGSGQVLNNSFISGTKTHVVLEVINNNLKITTEPEGGTLQTFTTSTSFGTCTVNSNLRIGRRLNLYSNGEIENLIIDGETFSFNEGNGATITGSNGTVATVNTSHAGGLNYINHEVIKPI